MFTTTKSIAVFAIFVFLFGVFHIGCNKDATSNPVAAINGEIVPGINDASVSFKMVFPQKETSVQSANILQAVASEAVVTFQIKLLSYGDSSNPFSVISKQVPVVNGSATAIFESLPTTTVLGKIHIENGKIEGYSDFHGALDLIQGGNTLLLAPVGSLMPQDVVANAVEEIVSSSTLFLAAPQNLVFELNKIVSDLLLDSSTAYEEAINNFTNRNGLPIVEIISPIAGQSFSTGSYITIVASATDLDDSISRVEFFQGSNKLGETTTAPFSCSWQCLTAGSYSLTAKAFDNNSAVGVASSVQIQVASPTTYTVTYNGNGNTSGSVPTDNQTYLQNATVTVKDNTGNLAKTGYTFAGWNTEANGSAITYNPNDNFSMGPGNIMLYAEWQPCFNSGTGSLADPFTISTPEHLNNVRLFADQHFVLINDIDLSTYLAPDGSGYDAGAGWLPIDDFNGVFDGDNFKISNLLSLRPAENYVGFFKVVNAGAQVKNLTLENLNVTSRSNGGFVSDNYGFIINCRTTGSVSAVVTTTQIRIAGGFVYRNYGTIDSCHSTCSVDGDLSGGFVAINAESGSISASSYSTGAVNGMTNAGGFALINSGSITACYSTGSVTKINLKYGASYYGGFVGNNSGTITNCYSTGSVSGWEAGGFAGYNYSSINKCFSSGAVSGAIIGGFASRCGESGAITNCFWDIESSGIPASVSAGGEGKTSDEMTKQATYVDWDFANVWQLDDSDGLYPVLR